MYKAITQDGYILALSSVIGDDITEAEYAQIANTIRSRPTPPDGYAYRLRSDLTWELAEMPSAPDEPTAYTQESLEAMTNAELEQIMRGYGITASMNKANMIRLILQAQGDDAE